MKIKIPNPAATRGADGMTPFERLQLFEAQIKLDFGIEEKRAYARASSNKNAFTAVESDFQKFRASRLKGVTLAKLSGFTAKAMPAATDDDGTPVPQEDSTAADVIDQISQLLSDLKTKLPAGDVTGSDDEQAAKAALQAGRKSTALSALNRAFTAVNTRLIEIARTASLSPMAKMANGFNRQASVQALMSPRERASLALSACGGSTAPVKPAVATCVASPAKARILALQTELAQLDKEQRKSFSNERNAKHASLSRELQAEMKKLRQ